MKTLHYTGELPVSLQTPSGYSVAVAPDTDFQVPDEDVESALQHGHVIDPGARKRRRSPQTEQDATTDTGSAI